MARGSISCNGGSIVLVSGFDSGSLDQDALIFELQSRFALTEVEAMEVIQASKVAKPRLPTIMIRLN